MRGPVVGPAASTQWNPGGWNRQQANGRSGLAEKVRVHHLARELGVSSKAILEKCAAEGLPVRNHMSTLSAGQVATIREWFSEGAHTTTVEESSRVDLEKVRVKRRPRKRAARKEAGEAEAVEAAATATAVSEAPPAAAEAPAPVGEPEQRPPEAPVAPAAEVPEAPAGALVSATVTEAPAPPAPPEEAPAAPPAAEAPPAEPAKPEPAPPEPEPEPVRPAGPQNIPAPATLKGPRIVRVERPDEIAPPRRAGRGPLPPAAPPPVIPGKPKPKREDRDEGDEEDKDKKRRAGRGRSPRRTWVVSESGVQEKLREWREQDLIEREARMRGAIGRGARARRVVERKPGERPRPPSVPRKGTITISEPIVLRDLCSALGVSFGQVAPVLMREHKMMARINDTIRADLAELLALHFGVELQIAKARSPLEELEEEFRSRERKSLEPRPPVVTFLGHVDHGKTSLLDAIRHTRVVDAEAGGITQHIGSYRLDRDGLSVTFLDTPGHEAFTALRARGAQLTDIVVLVVAADDGVMPQTVEAINHAKAAGVPIVVALNKIDLPGVDRNRVYAQLAEHDLVPTEWGGTVDVVPTSAVTGEGIESLIEHLATLAELLELKADPTVPATGAVIEAQLREDVGPAVRVLVQEGTLRVGSPLVCGPAYGRVRSLLDDRGRRIETAGPSTPVEIIGLDEVPDAGDRFYETPDLQRAKSVAEHVREQRRRESLAALSRPRSLEELLGQREEGEIPELNVILRADVQGSVDALKKALSELPTEEVRLRFLHAGVGAIAQSDVVLAEASDAIIIGFNVVPDPAAARLAEEKGVDIRLYRIIYEVVDDIRKALEGLLKPLRREEVRGRAVVRQVFQISRLGTVAGCYVTDGVIALSHYVRLIREGRIIVPTEEDVKKNRHRTLQSLKRFKDDVREVRAGLECGLRISNFDDIKVGDTIESYEIVEESRTL